MSEPLAAGVYPWTASHWQRLNAAHGGRHHAWLLRGPSGVGKRDLAMALARQWLSSVPGGSGDAGTKSRNLRLFDAATHPDLHCLMREVDAEGPATLAARYAVRYLDDPARRKDRKPRRVITIDQVRAVIAAVATRPQIAGMRAVLITPADAMTANAANALLKLLEEPPPDTLIVLETAAPHRLPATIRSRCLQVVIGPPAREQALEWLSAQGVAPERAARVLDLAGGAPIAARVIEEADFDSRRDRLLDTVRAMVAGHGDPVSAAQTFRDAGATQGLQWLHGLITDMIRIGFSDEPAAVYNRDQEGWLQDVVTTIDFKSLFRLLDVLSQARALLDSVVDEQLLLEDVLIRVDRVLASPWS